MLKQPVFPPSFVPLGIPGAYFVSPEVIVKIDILGRSILPIFRVPATSIPVHDPYHFIAVDKNIGAT
jgi:hypothetical protein